MLLFIIMNMSNYKVYFMRQNTSTLGRKVSAPEEYAITQGRSSTPLNVARALCDPFAPIIGRLGPSRTVCTMLFVVLAHCHPSAPISVLFVLSHISSSPSHLLSSRTGTSPRPFAFHLHV